eukprot:4314199-Pleurochrysis_carterae.AAC.2
MKALEREMEAEGLKMAELTTAAVSSKANLSSEDAISVARMEANFQARERQLQLAIATAEANERKQIAILAKERLDAEKMLKQTELRWEIKLKEAAEREAALVQTLSQHGLSASSEREMSSQSKRRHDLAVALAMLNAEEESSQKEKVRAGVPSSYSDCRPCTHGDWSHAASPRSVFTALSVPLLFTPPSPQPSSVPLPAVRTLQPTHKVAIYTA